MRKLTCHADAGDLPIERLEAAVSVAATAVDGGARLDVHFRLFADLGQLLLPPPRQGQRSDGLWRHSCFELFVRARGEARYAEVNLAPSGDWAAYAFSAYRAGLRQVAPMTAPAIDVAAGAATLDLHATLRLDELRPRPQGRSAQQPGALQPQARQPGATTLEFALAAVIEERSGRLTCWALAHPDPQRPDFHHPGSFVHEVRY